MLVGLPPEALNEGRGRDPGDTDAAVLIQVGGGERSTKAGAETPATLIGRGSPGSDPTRSTKAGAETPATRPPPRRCVVGGQRSTKAGAETPATPLLLPPRSSRNRARSTKAGAETPATLSSPASHALIIGTLNEGRGRDPGDTRWKGRLSRSRSTLNEGRGRDPGDTYRSPRRRRSFPCAQRRPGPRPRRHTGVKLTSCIWTRCAQRRPGPRPRRHAASAVA